MTLSHVRHARVAFKSAEGIFDLDKHSGPKVKVSVRNYTAIRRFVNKKHQAVDFCRDLRNASSRRRLTPGGSHVELDEFPHLAGVPHRPSFTGS
jgi:hypothetical protein